jgi:hypothetical protein
MNSVVSKIYNAALAFSHILSVIFSGLLLVSAFMSTCYAKDMTSQQVLTAWDNPLISIPSTIALAAFVLFTAKAVLRDEKKGVKKLLAAVLVWCLFAGAMLILFSKTVPAADAMSVYSIAERLAVNDTSVIHPTDSYLSYYPQQVGLVAFFEILIRLYNLFPVSLPAYHMIKCLYVILAYISILLGYGIVHLIWGNCKTDIIYILLSALNLPFIMYTSFVYGELPSYTALMAGIYFFLRYIKYRESTPARKIINIASGIVFLSLSVFLRKNSLIVIIAVVIIAVLQSLRDKRPSLALFALLCVVGSLSVLPAAKLYYEHRSGSTISSGVTATSYFAMGMQESSRANGWYNGFNFDTYLESGMNTEKANLISRQAISERAEYFKAHPAYAFKFYLGKYLSQWTDGTYASRQATLATFGGRQPFFESLYTGVLSYVYIGYCNAYQNLLYLGFFLFCIREFAVWRRVRRNAASVSAAAIDGLPVYLGIIAVFGGFLFHMLWEANSRYIFVYGMIMMLYAAEGLDR